MAASKYRLAVIYLKIVKVYNLSGYIVYYIIMLGRINHDSESSRGCLFMSTKSNGVFRMYFRFFRLNCDVSSIRVSWRHHYFSPPLEKKVIKMLSLYTLYTRTVPLNISVF